MPKSYSIADARNDLPGVIHDVAHGGPARITRRGKPVAVILSVHDYERITAGKPTFREAYEAWRSSVAWDEVAVPAEHFAGLRDRSPGRDVKL